MADILDTAGGGARFGGLPIEPAAGVTAGLGVSAEAEVDGVGVGGFVVSAGGAVTRLGAESLAAVTRRSMVGTDVAGGVVTDGEEEEAAGVAPAGVDLTEEPRTGAGSGACNDSNDKIDIKSYAERRPSHIKGVIWGDGRRLRFLFVGLDPVVNVLLNIDALDGGHHIRTTRKVN